MNLVKCEACGVDVSPQAKTCPKCGHPRDPSASISSVGRVIKVIVLVALLLVLAWAVVKYVIL